MGELATMMWKEFRDIIGPSKTRNQALISIGFFIVMVDFLFPFISENYEGSLARVLGFSVLIGFLFVMTTAPDMVAGERERHTLETLLSTRVPDRTILLGKLLTLLIVSTGISLFVVLQGLPIVSLLYGRWDQTLLYFGLAPLALVGSLAVSFAMGSLALAISARAQTVQGAQQVMAFAMMPVFMLFFLVPPLLAIGALGAPSLSLLSTNDFVELAILAAVIAFLCFAGGGVLLYLWALSRFRRPKMMLR